MELLKLHEPVFKGKMYKFCLPPLIHDWGTQYWLSEGIERGVNDSAQENLLKLRQCTTLVQHAAMYHKNIIPVFMITFHSKADSITYVSYRFFLKCQTLRIILSSGPKVCGGFCRLMNEPDTIMLRLAAALHSSSESDNPTTLRTEKRYQVWQTLCVLATFISRTSLII